MNSNDLFPQVYDELRKIAASKMRIETPEHTLNATALVHEVFLKLGSDESFASKSGLLRAAAVAMRRILVDHARSRLATKRGGQAERVTFKDFSVPLPDSAILELDEALTKLKATDAEAAEIVQLRYFSNLTNVESAEALGISPRSADRLWSFAKAWLLREMTR
jgi:RNA polymerase sigma factor (TIGR02999 family)